MYLNGYLYCVYAVVGGSISIRDPYICAVSRVCTNESHAVFTTVVRTTVAFAARMRAEG